MNRLVVLADPPRQGLVLEGIASNTPLSDREAADLYGATLRDAARTGATSGADLLVNYRPDDLLPEKYRTGESAETQVRNAVEEALAPLADDPHAGDARYEVQVGSTYDARVGNVVTHLLTQEDADSVAVFAPTAPLVGRSVVDGAGMKLRRSEVVFGPAEGGRPYYAGFTEPIDFEAAHTPPALETLTDRATDAGLAVDILDVVPTVETPTGLAATVSVIRARIAADKPVPEHTAEFVVEHGLRVREEDGQPVVVKDGHR